MINISDTKININKFLLDDCYTIETKERIKNADILIVPEYNMREGVEKAFMPDTTMFYKFFKTQEKKYNLELCENFGEEKIFSFHSIDLWIPTLMIVNDNFSLLKEFVFPFIINIVSSYVYDKIKNRKDNANIHFRLIINDKKNEISKELKFEGNENAFKESFTKIDINKLWNN